MNAADKARLSIYIVAAAAIVSLAGIAEIEMGRLFWGISGQPGVWAGDVESAHNSQFLFDPYTFSHITHGILLYALIWWLAGKLPLGMRALLAIAAESAWEVFENTSFVIEQYRAATISLHYYGDSVMNSMCDIIACALGFMLAAMLPTRVSIAGVMILELMLAILIRDGLLLNIIMLVHPIPALKAWQFGK